MTKPVTTPDPLSFLPLREPTFYILLSLTGGEKHGYAIIKSVESLSHGVQKLSTGTLYEALARLREQGLIERVEGPDSDDSLHKTDNDRRSRRRKAYTLTQLGLRVFELEMARLQELVKNAQIQLKEAHSG